MLILSRKPGQQILLGDGIVITVNGTSGGRVSLGIQAPADVRILRGELNTQTAMPAKAGRTAKSTETAVSCA